MLLTSFKAHSPKVPLNSLYGLWQEYEAEMPSQNGTPEVWDDRLLKLTRVILGRCAHTAPADIPVLIDIAKNRNFHKQIVWLQNHYYMRKFPLEYKRSVGACVPLIEKILITLKRNTSPASQIAYTVFKKMYLYRILKKGLIDEHISPEAVINRVWTHLPDSKMEKISRLMDFKIYAKVQEQDHVFNSESENKIQPHHVQSQKKISESSVRRFYILDHDEFIMEADQVYENFDADDLRKNKSLYLFFEKHTQEILNAFNFHHISKKKLFLFCLRLFFTYVIEELSKKDNLKREGISEVFKKQRILWLEDKEWFIPEKGLEKMDLIQDGLLKLFDLSTTPQSFVENAQFVFRRSIKRFPKTILNIKKQNERDLFFPGQN